MEIIEEFKENARKMNDNNYKEIKEEIELEIDRNGFDGIGRANQLESKLKNGVERTPESIALTKEKMDKAVEKLLLKFPKRYNKKK